MVSFGQGGAIWYPKRTRIPDFDRLVLRAGHDRLAIRRKGDGRDGLVFFVTAWLLLLLCRGVLERVGGASGVVPYRLSIDGRLIDL